MGKKIEFQSKNGNISNFYLLKIHTFKLTKIIVVLKSILKKNHLKSATSGKSEIYIYIKYNYHFGLHFR